MAMRRRTRHSPRPPEISPTIYRWLLRLLVPLRGQSQFISQDGFSNDGLAHIVGLQEWIDPELCDFDPKQVRATLRQLYESVEREKQDVSTPTFLSKNLDRL